MIIPLKGKTTYGKSPAYFFKIKENGSIDAICRISFVHSTTLKLELNYDIPGNTYEHEDAVQITRQEWLQALEQLKTKIRKYRG